MSLPTSREMMAWVFVNTIAVLIAVSTSVLHRCDDSVASSADIGDGRHHHSGKLPLEYFNMRGVFSSKDKKSDDDVLTGVFYATGEVDKFNHYELFFDRGSIEAQERRSKKRFSYWKLEQERSYYLLQHFFIPESTTDKNSTATTVVLQRFRDDGFTVDDTFINNHTTSLMSSQKKKFADDTFTRHLYTAGYIGKSINRAVLVTEKESACRFELYCENDDDSGTFVYLKLVRNGGCLGPFNKLDYWLVGNLAESNIATFEVSDIDTTPVTKFKFSNT